MSKADDNKKSKKLSWAFVVSMTFVVGLFTLVDMLTGALNKETIPIPNSPLSKALPILSAPGKL